MDRLYSFGFLCIVVLAFSTSIYANDEDLPFSSSVRHLTVDEFQSVIDSNDLVIVFFYAPWCGACKKAKPEFEIAAESSQANVVFAAMNAWDEANIPITSKYGVSGYPSIIVFRKGDEPEDYMRKDRTALGFLKLAYVKARPYDTKIASVAALSDFLQETYDQNAVIGFFDSESGPEYEHFMKLAKSLRDEYQFGVVIAPDDAMKAQYPITTPAAIIFKNFDEKQVTVEGNQLFELKGHINYHKFPLLDDVGKHNGEQYVEAGIPIAFFFVDTQENRDKYAPILKDIAKTTRGSLNFVFADWAKYGEQSPKFGLSMDVVPCLAIENVTSKFHYAFDQRQELNAENIKAFVDSFLAGELKPTVVSEPVPVNDEGVVKKVVSLNWNDLVMDPKNDVLLEAYSPTCGHCKKLAPVWEELGVKLKDVQGIVVAKVDASANDLDPTLGITKFPMIFLFKANDKENPVEYQGKDRSLEALLQFVQENASVKIDIAQLAKAEVDEERELIDSVKSDDDDDDDDAKKAKKQKKKEKKEKKDKKNKEEL